MKVRTNRKSTRGRRIYYQDVHDENGKRVKTCKHLQESATKVRISERLIDNLERLLAARKLPKIKPIRGRLIWNSAQLGTYVKALDGEIGTKAALT